jgi:hypothetical protein
MGKRTKIMMHLQLKMMVIKMVILENYDGKECVHTAVMYSRIWRFLYHLHI